MLDYLLSIVFFVLENKLACLAIVSIVALAYYFRPTKESIDDSWQPLPRRVVKIKSDCYIASTESRSPDRYSKALGSPLGKCSWSHSREGTTTDKETLEKLSKQPPRELYEPNVQQPIPSNIKPEIFFVLKALEVLELPNTWQLDPKDVDTLSFESESVLIAPGDPNDAIFVVLSGELGIFTKAISTEEQSDCNIKILKSGDSYFSQTSIIEILMNEKPQNNGIHLKAITNCRVAKYKLTSFYSSFISNQHQWVRTIQVVMTRFQQCTLITCNFYLGIGGKCINAIKKYECQIGTVVVEENYFEIELIFIVFGKLRLKRTAVEKDDTGTPLTFDVYPGDILPSLQILTNEPAICTAKAVEKTIYFKISRDEYIQFLLEHPIIYLRLSFHALHFASPFARIFDLAVSWHRIETGQALFRIGDKSDCMYIVMGGRLRAVDSTKILEEYGRMDLIGITDMAEKRVRRSTVMAVRFSHIVCIPENLLGFVKIRYPQVGNKLLQLISKCWKTVIPEKVSHLTAIKTRNLRTIAIVPASKQVPLTAFTCELYNELSRYVKLLRLSSELIENYFEPEVITKRTDYGLMHWLNAQEIAYSLVLYQCDFHRTSWTRRCLRMADAILVVAIGTESKARQVLVESLLSCNEKGVRQSKELVLLWPEGTAAPHGTADWIKESYYSAYHHIRSRSRVFSFPRKTKECKIINYYEAAVYGENDPLSDYARLARILTGNAIGVVFGGGGARGAAHAGALQAILDKKIPIDMVGGTSIGAFFGSLYATTPDARADRMKNTVLDVLRDLTWTYCAVITGHRFNLCVKRMLGDVSIEDCWISFFCVSTDLTASSMRIHRSGPMWPVVRSSMSIAGYVPPICDPHDGHLLLDGAYVNNLPADIMKSLGANIVIAIDVGMHDDNTNLRDYGYSISGTWCLFKRWWPFGEELRVLSMSEIQNRLAYVCCVNQMETVRNSEYCCYVKLPIESFGIFDFSNFDAAAQIGYEVTLQKMDEYFDCSTITRRESLGNDTSPARKKLENDNILSFVNVPIRPITPTGA